MGRGVILFDSALCTRGVAEREND